MQFSFKQIRYFVAAAESGQISLAAASFNVSQSAVTTAVRQLEEAVGFELLKRGSHGVSLTSDGVRFLSHAHQIIGAVDEAMRMPSTGAGIGAAVVKLGVTYTVLGYFLPNLLQKFSKSYPTITVEVVEMDRPHAEAALISGDLDVAVLLTSNLERTDALKSETLLQSTRRLWLPASHELASRPMVSLQEIADERYIALTVDEAWSSALRYWVGKGRPPSPFLKTSSVEAVRTMVGAGMGVTILSDMVYRPWSLDGHRIETRDVEPAVATMDIGLVWRSGSKQEPAVRTFSQFMQRAVGRAYLA